MQTVITEFLAPTNTRGSRIKVTSWLGSKTYSYDHAAICAHESAFNKWLEEINKRISFENHQALAGDWYKLVAKGSLPDGKGYGFIIK